MRPREDGFDSFRLPPLHPWMRNLLVALLVLYLVEVVARNFVGVPVDLLAWRPMGAGFRPWQLLSHYLVQGPGRGGTTSVLLSLLVLYFFLPPLSDMLSRRHFAEGVAAGAAGGVLLGLALDLFLGLGGAASGWSVAPMAMVVLFGLAMPGGVVRLFFVIPVTGRWIVWGTVAIAGLFLLADPGLDAAEHLGAALGVVGWWRWRGPGARRRELARKARDIERELRRFEVIEGGRGEDDDLVH